MFYKQVSLFFSFLRKANFSIPMQLIILEVYFVFNSWCNVLGRYAMELTNPQPSIFFYLSISEAYLDNVSTFELTQLSTHFRYGGLIQEHASADRTWFPWRFYSIFLEPTVMAASVIQRSKLWEVQVLVWG